VAAAERSYLPGVLASAGALLDVNSSGTSSSKFSASLLKCLSSALQFFGFPEDAPVYVSTSCFSAHADSFMFSAAILFSGLPAILFIFLGTFNGLVKFYGKKFTFVLEIFGLLNMSRDIGICFLLSGRCWRIQVTPAIKFGKGISDLHCKPYNLLLS